MGYVDESGKDAGCEQSVDWMSALVGILIGSLAGIISFFLFHWWVGSTQGPPRLRATATHQTLAFPAPVVAPPSDFAEMVKDRKVALAEAKVKVPALDLLVAVRARPEMSADEVAAQATELANRLRCEIEVRYKGKDVVAWPGMSKESFVKSYVERVEFDARKTRKP